MQPSPFQQRQRRRAIVLGLSAIVAGLLLMPAAIHSIRTGVPISTLRGPAIEGWAALLAFVLCVLLGVGVLAVGCGWIETRRTPPGD